MKTSLVFLIFGLAMCQVEAVSDNKAVKKTLDLLYDMMAKKRSIMEVEQVKFTKKTTWLAATIDDLKTQIGDAEEEMENLDADQSDATSRIAARSNEMQKEAADIAMYGDKKAEVEKQQKEDAAECDAKIADLRESVSALERAIVVMKQQPQAIGQDFLQTSAGAALPSKAQAVVAAFLQNDPNAYENQSGGIVDMLENLESEFKEQLRDAQKGCMNQNFSANMQIQDITGEVQNSNQAAAHAKGLKEEQTARFGKAKEAYEQTKDERSDMIARRDEYLKLEHKLKLEFPELQRHRKAELVALQEAIDILSKAKLIQMRSFLQMGSKTPNTARAVAFLIHEARKIGSKNLGLLTEKIAEDPFVKVRKMIYDMINKLKNQANEEAEHKGWCDTEMSTNKMVRDDKSAEVEKLSAESDKLMSEIAHVASLIAASRSKISQMEKDKTQDADDRREDYQQNTVQIKDLEDAIHAAQDAKQRLRDFYANHDLFLQKSLQEISDDVMLNKKAMDAFMQETASAGGTLDDDVNSADADNKLAFMDTIEADLQAELHETKQTEASQKKDSEELQNELARDLAVENQRVKNLEKRKADTQVDRDSTDTDLASAEKELGAARRYQEKLKPSCVDQGMSHEERMAKRGEEIKSLKEALEILNSQE